MPLIEPVFKKATCKAELRGQTSKQATPVLVNGGQGVEPVNQVCWSLLCEWACSVLPAGCVWRRRVVFFCSLGYVTPALNRWGGSGEALLLLFLHGGASCKRWSSQVSGQEGGILAARGKNRVFLGNVHSSQRQKLSIWVRKWLNANYGLILLLCKQLKALSGSGTHRVHLRLKGSKTPWVSSSWVKVKQLHRKKADWLIYVGKSRSTIYKRSDIQLYYMDWIDI